MALNIWVNAPTSHFRGKGAINILVKLPLALEIHFKSLSYGFNQTVITIFPAVNQIY